MEQHIARLHLPSQILAGKGSINRLHELIKELGGSRVFVLMDAFLASSPVNLDEKVTSLLKEANIESVIFSSYSGEPTTEHVKAALEMMSDFDADCVVGIGGGSALDLAKAISLFGRSPDLKWAEIPDRPFLKRLPLVAVPTTAGTGSEATKVMVVTNTETNQKMNPGHPHLIPDAAILDAELTVSLPKHFTAYTGLDALTHAIEAYVSNRATPLTDFFAMKAIKMIGESLPVIYEDGQNADAREQMIIASCYAGVAFSNASTNLAHAAGRPLGARFHIPHGLSVAVLMPFVMEYGLDAAEERYADVALALGASPALDQKELAREAVKIFEAYNDQFQIWNDAQKYINPQDLKREIPVLAADALSGNGIATNRKVPGEADVAQLFELLAKKLSFVLS